MSSVESSRRVVVRVRVCLRSGMVGNAGCLTFLFFVYIYLTAHST